MLQAINDRIKGWLGIAIVILIGLPFALWGIGSYLDDTGPRYAAKVNDSEISANEFERAVSMQRQQLQNQNGGAPVDEKALREDTLKILINQRLLEEVTYSEGYRISDTILTERIKQLFTVDGLFDRERFEAIVASNGMSVPMYEQSLRNELRLQQMQSAIANSAFVTKQQVSKLATLDTQTRDISVLTFNIDHFSTAAKPTEEEVKQFYEANMQRFMHPEKMRVDYVEVTSDSLAQAVEIDEQQVQTMYEEYVDAVSGREERKASHILIQSSDAPAAAKEKIELLAKQLEQGADFAALAKEHSEDPGSAPEGGDLGWVALGDMVKPFEQALFEMQKDAVSGIVETQFGYHLIKLEDVRGETVESIEVKRYEFEDELKKDAIASIFYDMSERLASLAYENPDSLDVVVEDLGLKVNTTDYFSRFEGTGIAENEKVRNIAYSALVLEQGSNSDIIEINPDHVVVVRLNEHVPATAIPLAEVSSKIENILIVQKGHEQTKAAALEVKARIEAGESIDSVKADGINVVDVKDLGRKDMNRVSDPSILQSAFDIIIGADGKSAVKEVDLISGDVALVVLSNINTPEVVAQDKMDLVRSEMLRASAIRDFTSALVVMKDNATIETNKNLLQR
jgi:peptidyl-prolyl cis-trans isomerase D